MTLVYWARLRAHYEGVYSLNKRVKGVLRSERLSADGIDPIKSIRDISSDLPDHQPVDVIRRINRRDDRSSRRNRVLLSLELLVRPEISDGGDPIPSGVGVK